MEQHTDGAQRVGTERHSSSRGSGPWTGVHSTALTSLLQPNPTQPNVILPPAALEEAELGTKALLQGCTKQKSP